MANNLLAPTVAGVPAILKWVKQQTFSQIAAGAHLDTNITIAGATPQMTFGVTMPFLDAGLGIGNVACLNAGVVTIRLLNVTTSPITPAPQDFYITSF